jgi:hypothetical protein
MQSRSEITTALTARFAEAESWFAERPDTAFCTAPPERWTEGQHLDHLIRSAKPLNLALRLPRIALRMKFGTAKVPGETMEALAARYEATLAAGGKASGRFVPPAVALEDKARLLEALRHEGERLVEVAETWSEEDLDKYVLPHPLLGDLTVRGMLFFTFHHMGHHLETLRRDYGGG